MAKQEFVYPGSDFDRARTLVAALGSFWARDYTAGDQVTSYVVSTAQQVNQTCRNLLETVAALSRYDIPLFHEEVLTPIVIKKSECNQAKTTQALFDETSALFDGELRFDAPEQSDFFSFPLPDKLVDVNQLFNQITFPTVALIKNVDFALSLRRRAIVFLTNPFDNPALVKRAITTNGAQDEEITLWGFFGKFDYDYVFNQFAYAVGLKLSTSQGYKDLTNAIISSLIDGGISAGRLDNALSAICGVPISAATAETVEVVTRDSNGLVICTDKSVYRFPGTASSVVKAGQVLSAGAQLIAGIDVTEFFIGNRYLMPHGPDELVCIPPPSVGVADTEWAQLTDENDGDLVLNTESDGCQPIRKNLTTLTVGAEFLSACFYSELVFENKEVPLVVDTDHESGYTYVSFDVGGFPEEVAAFFDEIHFRGIAAAVNRNNCKDRRRVGTLAHILDKRRNAETEPTATNLPETINPLRFIVENVLRNNVFVVRISTESLGEGSLGLYNIRHLRALIPPHTAMIVVFELGAKKDTVKATTAIREQISNFRGAEPIQDTLPHTYVRDSLVSVRLVSGTCQ
jgi:hypothetical protein